MTIRRALLNLIRVAPGALKGRIAIHYRAHRSGRTFQEQLQHERSAFAHRDAQT